MRRERNLIAILVPAFCLLATGTVPVSAKRSTCAASNSVTLAQNSLVRVYRLRGAPA